MSIAAMAAAAVGALGIVSPQLANALVPGTRVVDVDFQEFPMPAAGAGPLISRDCVAPDGKTFTSGAIWNGSAR